MKPLIGVCPDFNAGNRPDMGGKEPTYFLRARYLSAIEEAGGIPIILPFVTGPELPRLLGSLQGLLLTGSGSDLSPTLYGERQRFRYTVMSRQRSHFEIEMARIAVQTHQPLLGICGGMQSINVALGGTLFQDITSQVTSALQHQQKTKATRHCHSVQVKPQSLLDRIIGKKTFRVNSSHHQSVKDLAPALTASAVAPDGVIEAIESSAHPFFLGVQWHPEFLYERDPHARQLFQAFLKAAGRSKLKVKR